MLVDVQFPLNTPAYESVLNALLPGIPFRHHGTGSLTHVVDVSHLNSNPHPVHMDATRSFCIRCSIDPMSFSGRSMDNISVSSVVPLSVFLFSGHFNFVF